MRYIRFVIPERDLTSTFRQGVFHAALALRDEGKLAAYEDSHLSSVIEWFDDNLRSPSRFSRKRNAYHRGQRGLSWFKDSASEHLKRIGSIVAILEAHGIQVSRVVSDRPGYVVYEDEFQVVAEPFADSGV